MSAISSPETLSKRRWGIGTRLALAFALVVGMSSIACLAGLLLYERLSAEMQQIAQRELPRLSIATRLARLGADINANVSLLSRAETEADFNELHKDGESLLDELSAIIAASTVLSNEDGLSAGLSDLSGNLESLKEEAGRRFALEANMRALVGELRWLQSDMIFEIEPLIDDARFNLERDLDLSAPPALILRENERSQALLVTLAQANLAIGLLTRVSELSTRSGINDVFAFLDDSTDDLRSSIAVLSIWPDSITVRQLALRIVQLADRRTGVPALTLEEISVLEQMNAIYLDAQRTVETLGRQIGVEVANSEENSQKASANVEIVLTLGRVLLLIIVGASIAGACAVAYFYIHRNLVLSIRRLAADAVNVSEGRPASAPALHRDDELGDLAAALRKFRQTRDELIQSAKLAAVGQMATGIAHELNQPLSALRSYAFNGTRQLDSGKTAEAQQSFVRISALVERMGNQINHMRRFSRLPAANLNATSVATAIDEAIALLKHRFDEENAEIAYDPDTAANVFAIAELVKLEQVLVNLISNGLDALPATGQRLVSIGVECCEGIVSIRITDTGGGIAREDHSRVFDPFFTTKQAGAGLGLGLSISRNLASDFGGRLVLESTSMHGSSFLLTLSEAPLE
ncbi:MAG: putative two-component sensor histidine kinase protein [Devosia sp.]|nr:putative two-component sensor histidine kinase protein [Devosia sp.]